ncbi:MAG: hypothetical protein R3C53_19525 [Pirellulaceae bacterium]
MSSDSPNTVIVYDLSSDLRSFSTLAWADELADGLAQLIELLDGNRNLADIDRLCVERSPCGHHASDANTLPLSDSPWLCAGFIVLSQRAVDVFTDIIKRCGILLPLNGADLPSTYSLLHVTCTIEALDSQASDCSGFLDGRINSSGNPCFEPSCYRTNGCFASPVIGRGSLQRSDLRSWWNQPG